MANASSNSSTGCCGIVLTIIHVSIIEYILKIETVLHSVHFMHMFKYTFILWSKWTCILLFFIEMDSLLRFHIEENSFCWFTTKPDSMNLIQTTVQTYLLPFYTTETGFISFCTFTTWMKCAHSQARFRI